MTTQLSPESEAPAFSRLRRLKQQPIFVEYLAEATQDLSLGHQFLFFIVPFGHITFSDPQSYLAQSVERALLLRGYSPSRVPREPTNNDIQVPVLLVNAVSLESSAFDYFFMRRVVSEASFCFSLWSNLERFKAQQAPSLYACKTAEYRSWVEFAFGQQLQHDLNLAVVDGINQSLEEIFGSGAPSISPVH